MPNERENQLVLSLVQALVGSVSPNFRRVGLRVSAASVGIQFVLEQESESDREEIEDILFEFEALQVGPVEVHASVQIHDGDLRELNLYPRPVFGRKTAGEIWQSEDAT